jgi:hypothetical protein
VDRYAVDLLEAVIAAGGDAPSRLAMAVAKEVERKLPESRSPRRRRQLETCRRFLLTDPDIQINVDAPTRGMTDAWSDEEIEQFAKRLVATGDAPAVASFTWIFGEVIQLEGMLNLEDDEEEPGTAAGPVDRTRSVETRALALPYRITAFVALLLAGLGAAIGMVSVLFPG